MGQRIGLLDMCLRFVGLFLFFLLLSPGFILGMIQGLWETLTTKNRPRRADL